MDLDAADTNLAIATGLVIMSRRTYNDNWYRVANQKPRLLHAAKIHRQHFRGERWHVIENPLTNEFIRVDAYAWELLGRLNGRQTIDAVWQTCRQRFKDDAPTQDETIQLLTQLYQANLLHAGQAVNVDAALDLRKQRRKKQVEGQLQKFPLR